MYRKLYGTLLPMWILDVAAFIATLAGALLVAAMGTWAVYDLFMELTNRRRRGP